MKKFTLDNTIEDIVLEKKDAVKYFMEKGIRCIRCGEPIWDKLKDVLTEKGFTESEQKKILDEINNL
ncbi:DUF1858 domain-containing protein [Deferribacterales bacterium Es71-Z0220]|jgi:hypothetical protein|uniref:DUF1858 domain-containing protein n=1 Tax=Deferrivibrio essentukiensis TaxID=2880922 RepID=UPI001F61E7F4|nr:DUF1858 domain-containing protein [Deferrivibrio essentukiensis]MCB4203980.1 DUF1858 domain-containing protein [Deferrivibrio essentukiensis]